MIPELPKAELITLGTVLDPSFAIYFLAHPTNYFGYTGNDPNPRHLA